MAPGRRGEAQDKKLEQNLEQNLEKKREDPGGHQTTTGRKT